MANPQFVEQKAITLVETKDLLEKIDKRDEELNYRSNKAKEYLSHFAVSLTEKKVFELKEKLAGLGLTRLKEEHIVNLVDFLPPTINDLKSVLQAYPLSLPKKDQEKIVAAVKEFLPKKA